MDTKHGKVGMKKLNRLARVKTGYKGKKNILKEHIPKFNVKQRLLKSSNNLEDRRRKIQEKTTNVCSLVRRVPITLIARRAIVRDLGKAYCVQR